MAVKRTTINIDMELVDRAREALDAGTMTETITRALEQVVQAAALQRLATWKIDMTIEELEQMRKPREFEFKPLIGERDAS